MKKIFRATVENMPNYGKTTVYDVIPGTNLAVAAAIAARAHLKANSRSMRKVTTIKIVVTKIT